MTVYRLARRKYANISGVGAALAHGRWNESGQEALYTSWEISTPVLELLAHTQKDQVPQNLAMMHIRISGAWKRFGLDLIDEVDGTRMQVYKSLEAARQILPLDTFGKEFLAAAVPSVIVPAWNVVLFPQHWSFWDHVSLKTIEPFEFDTRLFPAGAL